mmetsp:Transcript_9767/g.11382  ORF Transcript_9767/g.11382 Transcript_9767/m.11382 type:complete len:365 (-) Transcript_9767:59-1153(-)
MDVTTIKECKPLVRDADSAMNSDYSRNVNLRPQLPYSYLFRLLALMLVLLGLCGIFVTNSNLYIVDSTQIEERDYLDVKLSCPTTNKQSSNDKDGFMGEFYNETNVEFDLAIGFEEIDEEQLKNKKYDGWSRTYNTRKKIFYEFKSTYFKSLQSGDSIFESGCGIGLNLLMTVEILKETANVDNLKVYGIEYIPASVREANNVLSQLLPKKGSELASPICRGDATDLNFVPSDSFDIAFTGYIDPIQDPLDLKKSLGRKITWHDLCKEENVPTEAGTLDQAAVEEWYAKWVSELVRITKPGKVIIVEEVSVPTCQNLNDWGGVSKQWWDLAISKYNWDVDVESLHLVDAAAERYHVYLKKNQKI